jgi:hypothetical protein
MLGSTTISRRPVVAGQYPSQYHLAFVSFASLRMKRTTNASSGVVASQECSPPPMDGPISGKRVVPATVRSSSNVPRENVYPACSLRRTLPRQPLAQYPHRLRLPRLFSPPPPQLLPHALLLHLRGALECPAYPSRSPRRAKKERSPLSGCIRVCSTSWTRS